MPLLTKPRRRKQTQVRSKSVPAPVGGWNARDSTADMDPLDAILLDNWYPEAEKVSMRNGHSSHATGMTSVVDSLMEWAKGSSQKMFAAADNSIFEVTASGAVGAAEISSLTNNRWQHANFGTAGGQFLIICNGADSVRNYDGSSWTTPTITNATSSTFIHVNIFKRRVWFIQKETLTVHYLPVNSIAGAAASIDLSEYTNLGGQLMAMGNWTIDGGDGSDDLAVFVTSKGEAIVFQGTDPSSASTWAMIGVFRIGEPIGRRCMIKLGGDLAIITQEGFKPMSTGLFDRNLNRAPALSDKIAPAVNTVTRTKSSNFGWQAMLYPKGGYVLFNIPIAEGSEAHQYVMNTATGSWCRFKAQNANCWAVFNKNLYFGGTGKVFKADDGQDDDGSNICGDVKQAFNDFGSSGRQKHWTMMRPIFETSGNVIATFVLNTDFADNLPTTAPSFSTATQAPWDTSPWDTTAWVSGSATVKDWQTVTGIGFTSSLRMQTETKTISLAWHSTDYIYKIGGLI